MAQDAAWILSTSTPLKCTCPSDVYILLKSSDFICHDLNRDLVFEGCDQSVANDLPDYNLELVLRKWYPVERSRELRCFVRQEALLGKPSSNKPISPSQLSCVNMGPASQVFRNETSTITSSGTSLPSARR